MPVIDLPGIFRKGIGFQTVDNPMHNRAHEESRSNPRLIVVPFNQRESYVSWLLARGLITHAENLAAEIVRRSFEAMGGSGARGVDTTRPYVDGGHVAQSITDGQLRAGETMREVLQCLGPDGRRVVIALAGEGRWPKDLRDTPAAQAYLGLRFRECLTSLAIRWGYQK